MVLESIVKYLMATAVLFFSLFIGWFASAKYLEPLILKVFNPQTHDTYLDIWFSFFVLIELTIVFGYMFYMYKMHKLRKPPQPVNK